MIRFDEQAETFDLRAGLADEICRDIANVLKQLIQPLPADKLLDIGAGTGRIGVHIAKIPLHYIGMDISAAMLDVFRDRIQTKNTTIELVCADANQNWPISDHSVRIIFSSRAIHWLAIDHVVKELFRVTSKKGAVFITGRVEREKDSVRTAMRRKMRELLKEQGIDSLSGEAHGKQLFSACFSRGALRKIDPLIASRWTVSHSPLNSLESWRMKPGLAGRTVPLQIKNKILNRLETWAEKIYGSLDTTLASEETYILEGVWLR